MMPVEDLITLSGRQKSEVLEEACQRSVPLELRRESLPEEASLPSRFLSRLADGGLAIEIPTEGGVRVSVRAEEQVFVSFSLQQQPYQFTGQVSGRDMVPLSGQLQVPAMVLEGPQEIQRIQRRDHYRVKLHGDHNKQAHLWLIEPNEEAQGRLRARPLGAVELQDVSAGGTRVLVPGEHGQLLQLERDVIISLPLDEQQKAVRLQAVIRFSQATDKGRWQVGLQFVGLRETHEGRMLAQQLEHHVALLERELLQRKHRPE